MHVTAASATLFSKTEIAPSHYKEHNNPVTYKQSSPAMYFSTMFITKSMPQLNSKECCNTSLFKAAAVI